jgi:hypothetical protein
MDELQACTEMIERLVREQRFAEVPRLVQRYRTLFDARLPEMKKSGELAARIADADEFLKRVTRLAQCARAHLQTALGRVRTVDLYLQCQQVSSNSWQVEG